METKKIGYTNVKNIVIEDRNLSLKAKGLYLTIQHYITLPNCHYTKDDYMRVSSDGKKSFDSSWKELKEAGYLKVHFYPSRTESKSKKHGWIARYELLVEPVPGPSTFYYNANGVLSSVTSKKEVVLSKPASTTASTIPLQESTSSNEHVSLYPNGTYANGGNKVNTKITTGKKMRMNCTNSSSSKKKTVRTHTSTSLNEVNRYILTVDEQNHYDTIVSNKQTLPEQLLKEPSKVYKFISYLFGFNHTYRQLSKHSEDFSKLNLQSSLLIMDCFSDMLLNQTSFINHTHLSNTSVLDRINSLIQQEYNSESHLCIFMDMLAQRYNYAREHISMHSPAAFIKTMIWNGFDTYLVDLQYEKA